MSGNLCEHCTAVCCDYIALPIEKPTTPADFDDVRWYLIHENVSVFVEDGDWYIAFQTRCRHLQPDYRCGIYETRPQICRKYSSSECDYHSGDYGWEHHFTAPEHLDEYIRSRPRRGSAGAPQSAPARQPRPRARRTLPSAAIPRGPAQTDRRGVPLPVLDLNRASPPPGA